MAVFPNNIGSGLIGTEMIDEIEEFGQASKKSTRTLDIGGLRPQIANLTQPHIFLSTA